MLGPKQRQTVRLLARPPAGLPDGEYWARLVVSAKGGTVPVSGVADSSGVRVALALEIRTVLPLQYRKGRVATGVRTSSLAAAVERDSLAVRVRLDRTGNAAFLGTLRGALVDSTGKVVASLSSPLAVYYDMEPRITAPLPRAGLPAGSYRLKLDVAAQREDLPAELVLATASHARFARGASAVSPARATAAFVTAALLAWSRLEAQAPVAVIAELSLGRYVSRTVPAYRSGDDALLPITQLADLAEIATRPLPGGGLELILQPGARRVAIQPETSEIKSPSGSVALAPADRVVQPGEQYVSTRVLSALLHVNFSINWSDLSVALLDADSLPVGRRIAREKARSTFREAMAARTPDLTMGTDRTRWDGAVLDYSILAPSQDVLGGAYSTALGLNVMGGSLEATIASAGAPRDGNVRFDGSWTGVWRANRWVSQLRVGDGLSSGPRPRTLRGLAVSNVPFLRPALFGDIPFQGGLGPGWQIEAYRGGRLLAIDSADGLGRFSLDVPVEYGENPVDFIAYGPFGEVRQFNQTYRVVSDVLPARRFEYGASLGGCRSATCRANGNVDVRYGLSPRWTVRGGMDQFWRDSLPSLSHPYVGVAGAIGNAWALEVEGVAAAVLRGAARYEPSENLRISTEYNQFATGSVQPILTPVGRRTQWTTNAMARPFRRRADLYLEASLDRITATDGDNTSGRVGMSLYMARLRLAPAFRVTHYATSSGISGSESFVSLNAFSLPFPELGPVLGQISGRAAWEVDNRGATTTMAAYLSRQLGNAVNVEAGAGWNRAGGTTLSLYLSTQLPSVRATTSITAPLHGPAVANQFVQGSLLYDPANRRMAFASGPSLERAGVSGKVFLDANGDGRWQTGEELIPDVRVLAGYTSALSDSAGRYRVWDLPAFEPVLVTVDSSSLASPLWVPAYGSVSMETGPNRFRSLDIPIVPAGVIEGRLVRRTPGGSAPVAGVKLVLKRRGSREVRSLVTFSDGDFYLMGVRPGEYELSADAAVLSRMGLSGKPLTFTMPASTDGATVDGLEVRVD